MTLLKNLRRIKNQILASFLLTLGCIAIGCSVGWFSPALLVFTSEDTPLDGPMSSFDVGWIIAYFEIGSLFGVFLFGLIASYIGNQRSIILSIIPVILSWPMIYFAKYIWLIGLSKIFAGIAFGGYTICTMLFLVEISDDKFRGFISGIVTLSGYVGVELGYIAGTYLTFRDSAITICALGLVSMFALLLIPSAPQHWLRVNNIKMAEKSLRFYRNCSRSKWSEHEAQLQVELQKLDDIAKSKVGKPKLRRSDFSNRKSIKGMIAVTGLVLVVRLCGSTPLIHYAGAIFKESGSTIDPNLSTVIMGTLQIVGYCCATIFMDLFGRKSLLLLSAAGGCVSLLVTSVFTYLVMHGTDLSSYNEVPVIFLSIFKFVIAIGIGPVPPILIPELLPRNIREFGTGYSLFISSAAAFVVLIVFPLCLEWIQLYGCLWFFAGVLAASFVFIWSYIPETKGINLNTADEC